jgi:hypothetical protein
VTDRKQQTGSTGAQSAAGEDSANRRLEQQLEAPAQTGLPTVPPGARLLTTDEAIELIAAGEHPEAATGNVHLDAALIDTLRSGIVVACRMPDGRLAFSRVPPTAPPA